MNSGSSVVRNEACHPRPFKRLAGQVAIAYNAEKHTGQDGALPSQQQEPASAVSTPAICRSIMTRQSVV